MQISFASFIFAHIMFFCENIHPKYESYSVPRKHYSSAAKSDSFSYDDLFGAILHYITPWLNWQLWFVFPLFPVVLGVGTCYGRVKYLSYPHNLWDSRAQICKLLHCAYALEHSTVCTIAEYYLLFYISLFRQTFSSSSSTHFSSFSPCTHLLFCLDSLFFLFFMYSLFFLYSLFV